MDIYFGVQGHLQTTFLLFPSFVSVFLGGGDSDDEDKMKVIYSPASHHHRERAYF